MSALSATSTLRLAPFGTAAATAIGVVIAVQVWATISNRVFPVIGAHDRAALWTVLGLGLVMCNIAGVYPYSISARRPRRATRR